MEGRRTRVSAKPLPAGEAQAGLGVGFNLLNLPAVGSVNIARLRTLQSAAFKSPG